MYPYWSVSIPYLHICKLHDTFLSDSFVSFIYRMGNHMQQTYLTTQELSKLIKYDVRTIRERLKDSVLFEGRHYFRPFNGRKILYIWESIESDMMGEQSAIPLTSGALCNG